MIKVLLADGRTFMVEKITPLIRVAKQTQMELTTYSDPQPVYLIDTEFDEFEYVGMKGGCGYYRFKVKKG
jgi:hypothetical protein